MLKKQETLAKLNAAIQRIADESESTLLKNMPPIFYNEDIPGSPFTGDVYCHAWFNIAEQEVARNADDSGLQNLIRVRIATAIYSMIDLLKDELKKL